MRRCRGWWDGGMVEGLWLNPEVATTDCPAGGKGTGE